MLWTKGLSWTEVYEYRCMVEARRGFSSCTPQTLIWLIEEGGTLTVGRNGTNLLGAGPSASLRNASKEPMKTVLASIGYLPKRFSWMKRDFHSGPKRSSTVVQ
jgi:hypothetical protein